jgi:hypothetical protein
MIGVSTKAKSRRCFALFLPRGPRHKTNQRWNNFLIEQLAGFLWRTIPMGACELIRPVRHPLGNLA